MTAYPRAGWRLATRVGAVLSARNGHVLARHPAALRAAVFNRLALRSLSTDNEDNKQAKAAPATAVTSSSPLPPHIKFRMPDLHFQTDPDAEEQIVLNKWLVKEGAEIKDDCHMCEIDTPDLSVTLDSGDEGFLARILVAEGTEKIPVGHPLAVIVPTEADVAAFQAALRQHPTAIEGYTEPGAESAAESESESESQSVDTSDGAAVLRQLHKLQKAGKLSDPNVLKMLRTMARRNDEPLLITFKGSFEDGKKDDAAFDADFFVQNAVELATEALAAAEKQTPTPTPTPLTTS